MSKVEDPRTLRERREYPYTIEEVDGLWVIFKNGVRHGPTAPIWSDYRRDEESRDKLCAYLNSLNVEYAEEFGDKKDTAALQHRMRERHAREKKSKSLQTKYGDNYV